jgi:hypothetical protein
MFSKPVVTMSCIKKNSSEISSICSYGYLGNKSLVNRTEFKIGI